MLVVWSQSVASVAFVASGVSRWEVCCGLVASGVVDESGVQACFLDAGSVCALPTLCFLSVLAVLVRNGSNRARG